MVWLWLLSVYLIDKISWGRAGQPTPHQEKLIFGGGHDMIRDNSWYFNFKQLFSDAAYYWP